MIFARCTSTRQVQCINRYDCDYFVLVFIEGDQSGNQQAQMSICLFLFCSFFFYFSFQFRKIITRYRCIGYNLNVMRQSACLVFNQITVENYAAFFNCTPVGRASDSMMALTNTPIPLGGVSTTFSNMGIKYRET